MSLLQDILFVVSSRIVFVLFFEHSYINARFYAQVKYIPVFLN